MTGTKPYSIAKGLLWEAYQQVRANRGAAGIDAETLTMFEKNLAGNLYKIWNRMSSGSYFPPPVKQVEIPKANGGLRTLGIPTVADRVAQTAVKLLIEPRLDRIFHPDSYGYRPGRSARQAVAITRSRCWQHNWVVEFDIKAAFDQIDHDLLMKAVSRHIHEDWIRLYIGRWLTTPFEIAAGERRPRDRGTPQGGVVSPLLMNLFMHYAFDSWMQRTHPQCPFARYADDAVVHCRDQGQAEAIMQSIETRLRACGLTMHPDKSKVVYCRDSNRHQAYPVNQFTFLGFTFRPRSAQHRRQLTVFTSFLPGVSTAALKRMRQTVKGWRVPQQSPATLGELAAQYNPVLQGWWNYYGAFYPTALGTMARYLDAILMRWARDKYRTLRNSRSRSALWLERIKRSHPQLFVHWRMSTETVR